MSYKITMVVDEQDRKELKNIIYGEVKGLVREMADSEILQTVKSESDRLTKIVNERFGKIIDAYIYNLIRQYVNQRLGSHEVVGNNENLHKAIIESTKPTLQKLHLGLEK